MPLYLSRLQLNMRDLAVKRDLENLYALHDRLVGLFDERPVPGKPRMLWRFEPDSETVWLQSPVLPAWSRLPAGYLAETADDLGFGIGSNVQVKRIDDSLARLPVGAVLRFRLATWPTYRKVEPPEPGLRRNRRYSVQDGGRYPVKGLTLLSWLIWQGTRCGFELASDDQGIPDVMVLQTKLPRLRADKPLALPHWITCYEGHLTVRDPHALTSAVARGIGPLKSYGFGLLSLGRSL